MVMKTKQILFVMFLLGSVIACRKNEIILFDRDEAGVYFQTGWQTRLYVNSETYVDSVDYSFSVESDTVTEKVLDVLVRTMGKVKDFPRLVKLSVDAENSTAMEGVHYEIDFDAAVIPAGASSISFPVKFFRTQDLMGEKIKLVLKLEDNENFKVYFKEQKNTNVYYAAGEQIWADRYVFMVSEIYSEPNYWRSGADDAFGPWSVSKFRFVNKVCEIPVQDWQRGGHSDSKVQAGRFPIYGYMVRNALQELADSGTPMLDDDGSYMQLGTNYEVDYSAYIE